MFFFENPFLLLLLFLSFSLLKINYTSFSSSSSLGKIFSSSTGTTSSFTSSLSKLISSLGSKSSSILASVWDVRKRYYLWSVYNLALYFGFAVLTRFWWAFCCASTAKFVWRYTELIAFLGKMPSKLFGGFLKSDDLLRINSPGMLFCVYSSSSIIALLSYPTFDTFFNMNDAWCVFLSKILNDELFILDCFFSWVNLIEYFTSEALVSWSFAKVFDLPASDSAHVWNVCVLLACFLTATIWGSF